MQLHLFGPLKQPIKANLLFYTMSHIYQNSNSKIPMPVCSGTFSKYHLEDSRTKIIFFMIKKQMLFLQHRCGFMDSLCVLCHNVTKQCVLDSINW